MEWLALGIAAAAVLLLLPVAACMVASGQTHRSMERGRTTPGIKL